MEETNADEVRHLVKRSVRERWTLDSFILAQVVRPERNVVPTIRVRSSFFLRSVYPEFIHLNYNVSKSTG